MNVEKESEMTAHAIVWATTNIPNELEALLKRNGFISSGNMLDQLVLIALKNSKPFRADFVALMAQYPEWATSYMAMQGEFANASGSVVDSSLNFYNVIGDNTPKKSFFTADNIANSLNKGLDAFLTLDKNKTDRAIADASQKVAMYEAGKDKDSDGKPNDETKSNTILYVVLGVVGVALVGGLIYFASKKP